MQNKCGKNQLTVPAKYTKTTRNIAKHSDTKTAFSHFFYRQKENSTALCKKDIGESGRNKPQGPVKSDQLFLWFSVQP